MSTELNQQQKLAAEAPRVPLLIVAGAGTGKTRTLVSRVIHLIEQGIPPERICAITFTNKAAEEMLERIHKSFTLQDSRFTPLVGTFHSLGSRILRSESRLLGRKPNFVIFDDHDSFDLIKKTVKRVNPENKKGLALTLAERRKNKEAPALFAQKISVIKNLSGNLDSLKSSNKPTDLLAVKIFDKYEEALEANNAFDFYYFI